MDDYWYVFHAFLSDETNRRSVEKLRAEGTGSDDVPTLRLLDTAVWMRYSGGELALKARRKCGL